MSFDDNDFKMLRRYSRRDAAAMLHARDSWLKDWVTDNVIPHQRSGKPGPRQRGVWFTYDDVLAIGRMMPSLMSARQANSRAEGQAEGQVETSSIELNDEQATSKAVGNAMAPLLATLSAEELQAFGGLASLRA